MAPGRIPLKLAARAVAAVMAVEIGIRLLAPMLAAGPLAIVGLARCIQVGLVLAFCRAYGWQCLGLAPDTWTSGLRRGLMAAGGFGAVVLAVGLLMQAAGHNPMALIRTPLPGPIDQKVLFFLVAGFIGPVAEEVFFRGIVYGALRPLGVVAALLLSTVLFVALHRITGLPVAQAVGGIVFALAYEWSASLITPMVIHILGNLAIFSLSLMPPA